MARLQARVNLLASHMSQMRDARQLAESLLALSGDADLVPMLTPIETRLKVVSFCKLLGERLRLM